MADEVKMKKNVLCVLSGGGHTAQMIRLINLIGEKYLYEYVILNDDEMSENKIFYSGEVYRMKRTRNIKENMFIAICKQFIAMPKAISIILKSNPYAIIAAGSSISAPLCFAAKLLKCKVIFIESWSRLNHKSLTGKFAYYFADLFFVQHESMLKLYPKATYAGCIP